MSMMSPVSPIIGAFIFHQPLAYIQSPGERFNAGLGYALDIQNSQFKNTLNRSKNQGRIIEFAN
jgi:hypothetical protein